MFRERICKACDFYKPGDNLECAGFKILQYLIEKGRLSIEEVEVAISEACEKNTTEKI